MNLSIAIISILCSNGGIMHSNEENQGILQADRREGRQKVQAADHAEATGQDAGGKGEWSRNLKDRSGERYGRLTAICPIKKRDKNGELVTYWLCRCDCGTTKEIKANALATGGSTSCGCLRLESVIKFCTKHGRYGSPEYVAWDCMIQRCTNERHKAYFRYGGAGITICDRWFNFKLFFDDMGERPIGTTLDRINGKLGYSPKNCRWATRSVQNNNTSRTIRIEFHGREQSLSQWCVELGLSYERTRVRIKNLGYSIEEAFFEKKGKRQLAA